MTIKEINEKYSQIEDKIPSKQESHEKAAIELAQDIVYEWNITEPELYRVISLLASYTKIDLTTHLDYKFGFMGLYPNVIKTFNIKPDEISKRQ